jgi:hypothetical protein
MNEILNRDGYLIIKNFIPKELCQFANVYFKIKQDSLQYEIDSQCPESKSFYADTFIETLLLTSCKKLTEVTGINLIPQYSYARVYGKGEVLKIHRDRPECQYSATLCLSRPKELPIWPIFFSKEKNVSGENALLLEEGDLCFYKGTELYHWRNECMVPWHLQAFLHYVDKNDVYGNIIYDGRRSLGIKK